LGVREKIASQVRSGVEVAANDLRQESCGGAEADERHGVVLALADIHADEHIDALRTSWILHTGLPLVANEDIPIDQRQPASASTLQAVSVLDRSPISDSWLPTGSGDNTPRIMVDWAGIMPDQAGPKPHYRGWKKVTGARSCSPRSPAGVPLISGQTDPRWCEGQWPKWAECCPVTVLFGLGSRPAHHDS